MQRTFKYLLLFFFFLQSFDLEPPFGRCKAGLSSIEDVDPLKAYDDADTFAMIGICVEVTGKVLA